MLRPAYVRIVPALVLLAGLLTAGNAWYLQRDENRAETNRQLNRAAAEAAQTIEDRLQIVEHTLHGARGAMVAVGSRSFDEESFRRFAEAIDFRDELPGALALGFVRRVDAADLAAYHARDRREGREVCRVHPVGPGRAGGHVGL